MLVLRLSFRNGRKNMIHILAGRIKFVEESSSAHFRVKQDSVSITETGTKYTLRLYHDANVENLHVHACFMLEAGGAGFQYCHANERPKFFKFMLVHNLPFGVCFIFM
jgi:hypothetical protein